MLNSPVDLLVWMVLCCIRPRFTKLQGFGRAFAPDSLRCRVLEGRCAVILNWLPSYQAWPYVYWVAGFLERHSPPIYVVLWYWLGCQNFVMTNNLIKNMSGKISALATGLCPRGMNQSFLTRKVPTFLNSDPAPLQSYTQKAMTKNINRCSLRVSWTGLFPSLSGRNSLEIPTHIPA